MLVSLYVYFMQKFEFSLPLSDSVRIFLNLQSSHFFLDCRENFLEDEETFPRLITEYFPKCCHLVRPIYHNVQKRFWKNLSLRRGPTPATQEVHLSHVGGQHQQFCTTDHYADIIKNSNSISTYHLLNRVNCFW